MEFITDAIKHFIEAYGALAYLLIAGIVFLENAGVPLPGETTLILAGTFTAGAHPLLSFPLVLLAAISGAVLGDNMGYFIGYRFGRDLVLKYGSKFGMTADKFDRAEAAFLKNSGWAVFIGRFILLMRILAGPLAGITRMPYPKFVLFNTLGAISWATAITSAAYFFGSAVAGYIESVGVWGLGILVVGIILFGIIRHYMDEKADEKAAEAAKQEAGTVKK
ncbi:MAG: DedA family protein [Anaerolineae bacterium]|nr:DedA family protein [Gloeobacterales cyanobacterium ES-bin-313]